MAKKPVPLRFEAQVTLDKPQMNHEPFHFKFTLKNISERPVILNMWYAEPQVAELGPASLVTTRKINIPRGRQRPPRPSDVLRLQPGEIKEILVDHWAFETFPYYTKIINQTGPDDETTSYILKGKGSYQVTFCWTFYSLNKDGVAKDFLKPGEDFWQGQVCTAPVPFEVKYALPKN